MEQHLSKESGDTVVDRGEAITSLEAPAGGGPERVQLLRDIHGLGEVRSEWNRLAALDASPFLTYEWIASWWNALGDGHPLCILLRGPDNALRAGAFCRRSPSGWLTAPTDPYYSEEWDVVAGDDDARREPVSGPDG